MGFAVVAAHGRDDGVGGGAEVGDVFAVEGVAVAGVWHGVSGVDAAVCCFAAVEHGDGGAVVVSADGEYAGW